MEHLGAETLLMLKTEGDITLMVKVDGVSHVRSGDSVSLGVRPEACQLFNAAGKTVVFSAIASPE
nr:TOBE domain-containing protein [Marinicella sp. W31]MDC2875621.1 TOBE domain-containing protein [Marinicella sp. W31]